MREEKFGNITLVHGDCMNYMRLLPDNAFELAIVDPPYGDAGNGDVTVSEGGLNDTEKKVTNCPPPASETSLGGRDLVKKIQANHAINGRFARYGFSIAQWDTAPDEEYFKELFRVSRNQIIWGANYFPNMPPSRCFIIWRKLTISEKFSMAMAEYAWTSFNQNAKVYECMPQSRAGDPRFHPTQKPVELYAWLLSNYAKEGDKILDTHGGSMSHAIAAHNLGFELTIIEKDDEYYSKARQRLINHQRQLNIEF